MPCSARCVCTTAFGGPELPLEKTQKAGASGAIGRRRQRSRGQPLAAHGVRGDAAAAPGRWGVGRDVGRGVGREVGRGVRDDEVEARAFQQALPLLRRQPRVDTHRHATGPHRTQPRHRPFDAVGQAHRHAPARLQPMRAPDGRRARHGVAQGAVADVLVATDDGDMAVVGAGEQAGGAVLMRGMDRRCMVGRLTSSRGSSAGGPVRAPAAARQPPPPGGGGWTA